MLSADEQRMPTLDAALTLYLTKDADRVQVARLVKSLMSLNGIYGTIEIHSGGVEDVTQ